MKIALLSGADTRAAALTRAFMRRGHEVLRAPLSACAFDLAGAGPPVRVPGFEALPQAVFVANIDAGSFEAVTHRLGILHALEALGVRVWNPARAVERCVDKSAASLHFIRCGVATPPTWSVESLKSARDIVAREAAAGHKTVMKPLFGSQGKGLRLLAAPEDLPPPEEASGVYYLQRYVGAEGGGWRDHRLLAAGGRLIAAMTREGTGWITNIKQGAAALPWAPPPEAVDLALRAAAAVGAKLAGVDLIQAPDGRWLALEVNSTPAWRGLQSVADIDIAQAVADAFLEETS